MEMDGLHTTKRSRLDPAYGSTDGWTYTAAPAASDDGITKNRRGVAEDREDSRKKEGVLGLRSNWHHHASRICRVSRASGGKDRHSKVLTAKGLRDRRVRLSVSTAIQFYDLQDRLGVDQPSKAVEWLIKAASVAIDELPALDGPFLEHPQHLAIDEKPRIMQDENEEADNAVEHPDHIDQQHQHFSLSKSACSSTSETTKGSALSLSYTECRVKAGDHAEARENTNEKQKNDGGTEDSYIQNLHHHSSQGSFTDLLTSSAGSGGHGHGLLTLAHAHTNDSVEAGFAKQFRHVPVASAAADYFGQAGIFGQGHKAQPPPGFPAQTHFGNSSSVGILPFNATTAAGDHAGMQPQFSFLQEHLIPIAAVASGGEYSLNFSISSGFAGFNRGTLQSNSHSIVPHHHHLQRRSSPIDGTSQPFFLTASTPVALASEETHFSSQYDSRLQLFYGNGYRTADLKEKGND